MILRITQLGAVAIVLRVGNADVMGMLAAAPRLTGGPLSTDDVFVLRDGVIGRIAWSLMGSGITPPPETSYLAFGTGDRLVLAGGDPVLF